MEFVSSFGFQMSIFFRKMFHDFQKIFDKICNHKIKEDKNLQNFLTSTDRRNWKENVKNNKKNKKTNSKPRNVEQKFISHIYIFVKQLLEISRIRW